MSLKKIFFFFLAVLQHMEVPRPGIESELQLRPTPQLQQCQIPSPAVLDQGWKLLPLILPAGDSSGCSRILHPLCQSGNSVCYLLMSPDQECVPHPGIFNSRRHGRSRMWPFHSPLLLIPASPSFLTCMTLTAPGLVPLPCLW